MLKNKNTHSTESSSHNQINVDTIIVGNIQGKGSYRIDGKIEGDINTLGKIVIGEKGKTIGNITCEEVVILGTVLGTINTSSLTTLKSSANVEGEIISNKLVVEAGANLNGKCNMKKLNTKNTATRQTTKK